MTLAIILVVAAALALLLILGFALSRNRQISPNALAGQIQPIDVAAFRNLIDPDEDAYLRRRLVMSELRVVQRARLRATACYVRTAWSNAGVLTRMGQNALADSDARTAEAARQLIDNAALLRQNAAYALFKIYVAMAWPRSNEAGMPVLHSPVLQSYERLNGTAMLLGRLQNPSAPLRIAATL
jgi:hypothetical protein